jgi:Na+/melibiose symporter-like transporter
MSDLTQSKIRTGTKFFYAMGEFPGGYLTTLLSFFFLIYMTDFIKISPAWAGLILFLGFVFDGITDPLAGYMSDKSRHPFGRRRIYMLATIIPLGAVFCALFIIPSLVVSAAPWVRILVILVVYFVYILLYTFYTTPYFAIINDMTDSYDERTSMMSWRMSLSILAVLISVLIPDFLGLSDVQTFSFEGFW